MASKRSDPAPRVPSFIGLAALLCSLLSLASCIIISGLSMAIVPSLAVGVAVLPLLGLTGVLLGAVSILRKKAPGGRDYERGPAVGAIIVGLATAVLQGAFGIGILRTYIAVPKQIIPVVSSMVSEIQASNLDRARQALAEPVRAVVPAPRLQGFYEAIHDACGGDPTPSFTIGTIGRSRAALARALAGVSSAPDNFYPKPVEMIGPGARIPLWVLLDDSALDRDQVKITDMLALLPGDRALVLLPDGRFAQLARTSGLTIIELPTAPPPESLSP